MKNIFKTKKILTIDHKGGVLDEDAVRKLRIGGQLDDIEAQ